LYYFTVSTDESPSIEDVSLLEDISKDEGSFLTATETIFAEPSYIQEIQETAE
jgi:hypothetical protein